MLASGYLREQIEKLQPLQPYIVRYQHTGSVLSSCFTFIWKSLSSQTRQSRNKLQTAAVEASDDDQQSVIDYETREVFGGAADRFEQCSRCVNHKYTDQKQVLIVAVNPLEAVFSSS